MLLLHSEVRHTTPRLAAIILVTAHIRCALSNRRLAFFALRFAAMVVLHNQAMQVWELVVMGSYLSNMGFES